MAPMTLPTIGSLVPHRALDRPDLLAEPVAKAMAQWEHAADAVVVEIDPVVADTQAFVDTYGSTMTDGANCVVVGGTRAGEERVAACMVRADLRADVNNVVRRLLDVRKASFLSMDQAVAESGMEYGGITPFGLPQHWRLFVDEHVLDIELAVVGSGVRRSKVLLPGRLLGLLPRAEVVPGLAR
jgi:prolyl-tRNA editing enzyme YbaK/EbsC (Cys-tRNA(Pro) deacylase)